MDHPFSHELASQIWLLAPEMVLTLAACVLFLGGLYRTDRKLWSGVAVGSLGFALLLLWVGGAVHLYHRPGATVAFGVPFWFDGLSAFTRTAAILAGIGLILVSWDELPEKQTADYLACLLLITAGTALVGASNDLVALFAALELISIPTYVLLYLPRKDEAAQEAALKYFLLSIFSSALLLFGFSYLFGMTGTTNIAGMLNVLHEGRGSGEWETTRGLGNVALVMVVAGLGFRIAAVPFHFYVPDVYQGTSVGAAALLAVIPKIAGFVALIRVLGFVVPEGVAASPLASGGRAGMALSDETPTLLWFLAAITMSLGNLLALPQDNLRRMLGYSSVAHAGYMLVALASTPYLQTDGSLLNGVAPLLFYLVTYGVMTLGVFGAINLLSTHEHPIETIDDLSGLAKSHPATAFMIAVLFFSLIGIPLTAGFTAKFLVFFSAISVSGDLSRLYLTLALIGMVNAGIAAWYYLRVITVMYLRPALRPRSAATAPVGQGLLIAMTVLTLALSLPPAATWVLSIAKNASTPVAQAGR